uniref:cytochrome P450 89A2-like n=1 Tax=Erigeron canadensis TaxID=72917 RepID=UPI001CB98B63|nr:cytochrome P450 89A2-like [Erigeron canadensis]
METWFILILSLFVAAILFHQSHRKKLPPGPSVLASNFVILTNSLPALEPFVRNFKLKYGSFITLFVGYHPSIFVSSHSLAHKVLVQQGAIFSDRPTSIPARNISSASYGPTWRLLRRNLATEILHPARVKSYSWARKWALHILINQLREHKGSDGIKVVDHFHYAMFCLLVLMCFGDKLDEKTVNEIARVQRYSLFAAGSGRFDMLGLMPRLGKILFRNRWKELLQIRHDQEQVMIPLIKSRIEAVNSGRNLLGDKKIVAYVDTLVNLKLPEEEADNGNGGKLTDKEIVSMCDEFLNAGTDTTSTALQWIMANLMKYPRIQSKLFDEIVSVVGPPPRGEDETAINEEDLHKMPYLKAVVLEGLRRHPPGHFVLPHRVMKEVYLEGYMIPQGATINFMVADMGWDPKVWDDPMEFKPERFLVNGDRNCVFDISGSKGIKMMPFGAGRRVCPGSELAILQLEYYVANLIWYFHWTSPDGYEVDLSEKPEFTIVMKHPLRAHVSSRTEKLII